MKRILKSLFIFLMPLVPMTEGVASSKNPFAVIKTTEGVITVELFHDRAPKTVENFVGLAKGTKKWDGQTTPGQSLYAGTIFHRVIKNFMIQGGDPQGTGMGGPGYRFEDEFHPKDKNLDHFGKPYILAMANAGPGTNGSQFFITVVPTPHLDGKHTIFGEVKAGTDIVDKIVNADAVRDRPNTDIKIEKIEITYEDPTKKK